MNVKSYSIEQRYREDATDCVVRSDSFLGAAKEILSSLMKLVSNGKVLASCQDLGAET